MLSQASLVTRPSASQKMTSLHRILLFGCTANHGPLTSSRESKLAHSGRNSEPDLTWTGVTLRMCRKYRHGGCSQLARPRASLHLYQLDTKLHSRYYHLRVTVKILRAVGGLTQQDCSLHCVSTHSTVFLIRFQSRYKQIGRYACPYCSTKHD